MDLTIIAIIIQLIFLEGVLSIDNAAVLGTMVITLPKDQPIPWPPALRFLARPLNPILGKQRMAALKVGLLGAYLGRGLMLFLASFIVKNPWLKLLGALYLIRLAFENLGMEEGTEEETHERRLDATRFWVIVLNVEIADLIFSLDNVVAAVSLSDKLWVVMIGVALGILTMRFAAGFFSYAIEREPVLKSAAYLLVLNIGFQLILEDLGGLEINDWVRFGLSLSIIFLSLAYAHSKLLRRLRPVIIWIAQGFGSLNQIISWFLTPLFWLFRLAGRGLKAVVALTRRPAGGAD
jgi:tellurite resistance protein TerC